MVAHNTKKEECVYVCSREYLFKSYYHLVLGSVSKLQNNYHAYYAPDYKVKTDYSGPRKTRSQEGRRQTIVGKSYPSRSPILKEGALFLGF